MINHVKCGKCGSEGFHLELVFLGANLWRYQVDCMGCHAPIIDFPKNRGNQKEAYIEVLA